MITMIDTYNQQPTLYLHSDVYLELTIFKAELLIQVPSSVNSSLHPFLFENENTGMSLGSSPLLTDCTQSICKYAQLCFRTIPQTLALFAISATTNAAPTTATSGLGFCCPPTKYPCFCSCHSLLELHRAVKAILLKGFLRSQF